MKGQVTITKNPETGEVFNLNMKDGKVKLSKDNRRFGYVRFEQQIAEMSGGVITSKTRSALKAISEDDYNKLSGILVHGAVQPGANIRRVESTEKTGDFSWSEKKAGNEDHAPSCTIQGRPIYQRTELVESGDAADVLIAHDNADEIKAWQAENAKILALNK